MPARDPCSHWQLASNTDNAASHSPSKIVMRHLTCACTTSLATLLQKDSQIWEIFWQWQKYEGLEYDTKAAVVSTRLAALPPAVLLQLMRMQ